MNFFKPVEERLPKWLSDENGYSDVIISSRARIARNLKDYPYQNKITDKKAEVIIEFINNILKDLDIISKNIFLINLNFLPQESKKFLRERFLATDYMMHGINKEIISEKNENFAILVNEEDHLRIQSIAAGFSLDKVFNTAISLTDKLENKIEFDFCEEFGYLTACPTNTGTGLRLSIMMHLPALSWTKRIKPLFSSLAAMGISIRGFYGEGSETIGAIFQISNQYTMGESEEQIKAKLKRIGLEIYEMEKNSRKKILKDSYQFVSNKTKRALNLLAYSESLKLNDALELLADLRLGVSLNMVDAINLKNINKLFILIHPMHLLNLYGLSPKDFTKEVENRLRATIIKKYMHQNAIRSIF